MNQNPFTCPYDLLPSVLPLFPWSHNTILPGCQLPLNIFEPRYLNLIFDALGQGRMVGVIQPVSDSGNDQNPPLFHTGVAGRIVSYAETPDNRLLIVLTGVCRFDVEEETLCSRGYRQARVDWSRYEIDFRYSDEIPHDRQRLFSVAKDYFKRKKLDTNWGTLDQMPTVLLVNFLCSQLPFSVAERQSLIETISPQDRLTRLQEFMAYEIAADVLSLRGQH